MIVVTGATGQLGKLVVAKLIETLPPNQIVTPVRNVEKARELRSLGVRVVRADYARPDGWDEALAGARKVLLISSSEVGQRAAQHRTVVDAVARAKSVELLAYTSVLRADRSGLGLAAEHVATEAMIRAAGVPFALLRNGWYLENNVGNLKQAVATGQLFGAARQGRISGAARRDYADAAAAVLTGTGFAGRTLELAGDRGFTLTELAAEAARVSGRPVAYVDLPEGEYRALLVKFGLPAPIADMLADSDTGISRGDLHDDGGALSRLIGRPTESLGVAVERALA